jgi:hypothetical protein
MTRSIHVEFLFVSTIDATGGLQQYFNRRTQSDLSQYGIGTQTPKAVLVVRNATIAIE